MQSMRQIYNSLYAIIYTQTNYLNYQYVTCYPNQLLGIQALGIQAVQCLEYPTDRAYFNLI